MVGRNTRITIGRRPILAFGNSDGDLQMLQWTTAGNGPRFALIVHHTDAEREWAYDRNSSIGRLDKALDEAQAKGWTIVSMKDDWKTIFPSKVKKAPSRSGRAEPASKFANFLVGYAGFLLRRASSWAPEGRGARAAHRV